MFRDELNAQVSLEFSQCNNIETKHMPPQWFSCRVAKLGASLQNGLLQKANAPTCCNKRMSSSRETFMSIPKILITKGDKAALKARWKEQNNFY